MIYLFNPNIKGNAEKYTKQCLETNWVGYGGNFTKELENKITEYTQTKYAVACLTGTSAIHLALMASNIQPGHEIIVPTITFVATIAAIRYVQAYPVFMDCDNYLNIDVDKVEHFLRNTCRKTSRGLVNRESGDIVKAIMPVHVFGTPCNMIRLVEVANEFELDIIEDSAEALGSFCSDKDGLIHHCGSFGKAGIFSFSANKIITAGTGGVLVTNDNILAERANYLASYAKDDPYRYIHNEVGYNYKISNIQAALGLSQFELLEEFITTKTKNYHMYKDKIRDIPGLNLVSYPEGTEPNFWLYGLLVDKDKYGISRDQLMDLLAKEGIQTRPLWKLNHTQKPYQEYQHYEIEKAYEYYERCLNIPCGTDLTEEQIDFVVDKLLKFSGQL